MHELQEHQPSSPTSEAELKGISPIVCSGQTGKFDHNLLPKLRPDCGSEMRRIYPRVSLKRAQKQGEARSQQGCTPVPFFSSF